MRISIKIIAPGKKGIARRLTEAVECAGGIVEDLRITRPLKGMSEMALTVKVTDDRLRNPVIDSLGSVSGVAVLSTSDIPE